MFSKTAFTTLLSFCLRICVRQATNAMDHLDKSKLPSISAASALRRSRRFLLRGRSTVNLSVALRKAVSTSSTRVFRTCLTTRCISTIRSSMSPKLTLSRSQVPTVPSLAYASLRSLFSRVSKGMNRILFYHLVEHLSHLLGCAKPEHLVLASTNNLDFLLAPLNAPQR